jgi:Uma2 family endonuclease
MHSAPTFNPAPLYERLLALPDHVTGEILNGHLHTEPRPSGRHGLARSALSIDIGGPFDFGRGGPGGWWIIPEPEVHFVYDAEVAVPDLAGWRRERMPSVPEDQRFEVVPDWVCEILSPTTAKKDRVIKLPLYARYGVAYAWLVDPLGRTLEAFELRDKVWTLIATHQDDALVHVPPFHAIELPLNDLWA